MAGVLLSLQSSLKQLVQASKAQTEAFNNLREDILLQPDPNEEDKDVITDGTPNYGHKSIARREQRPQSKVPA